MLLVLALILDAAFGEPRWIWSRIPHPAVIMGRAVNWIDATYNQGGHRKFKGVLSFAGLCIASFSLGLLIAALPFGAVFQVVVAAILLAHRSLVDHVKDVADALRLSDSDGRMMVARIVGRDTSGMDRPAIARSAIESAAENFSDGIVAPAFWFAVAGLPGILLYKMTNTADSMIGYRTPRHQDFGWAAARFDDVLNWVPARLTALIFIGLHTLWTQISAIKTDAGQHRSPNAGWPEAAMARALGVALSGPRSYEGKMQDFAYVNETGTKDSGPNDIDASVSLLWRSWITLLGIAVLLALFN